MNQATNNRLLLPYVAPYFAYVCIASFLSDVVPIHVNYALRIAVTLPLLLWGWKWYIPLTPNQKGTSALLSGILYGVAGCFLWILLLTPFVDTAAAEPWSTGAFVLRFTAAGLLVPVFEEFMIHGFAFRLALQWDQCRKQQDPEPLHTALSERSINSVANNAWSWPAVLITSIVFMIGHAFAEWPAAFAYCLLITLVLIREKSLLPCIIAHGTTNILLGLYVIATGSWYLW